MDKGKLGRLFLTEIEYVGQVQHTNTVGKYSLQEMKETTLIFRTNDILYSKEKNRIP